MKNNIFAALISLLIIITPQLALSAEGSDAEEEESGSGSGAEDSSSGTAAGSGAAGSAIGGISLGTVAAIVAIAAAAAALALGLSIAQIARGLGQVRPYHGRLMSHQLSHNRCVIDDTYNANPGSVKAAISVLQQQSGERCFMLGDLGELGEQEVALHQRIGQQVADAGIEWFYGFGPLAQHAIASYRSQSSGFAKACENKENLISCFAQLPKSNLSCLVKGSRSSHMERVVEQLLNGGN